MDPNEFVTKELFKDFRETIERRIRDLENWQASSSSEISTINTNVELLLQKMDNLIKTYGDDTKLIHQRINDTRSQVNTLKSDINDHVNVQPSQDYKNLKAQIILQILGFIILGVLGSILAFK